MYIEYLYAKVSSPGKVFSLVTTPLFVEIFVYECSYLYQTSGAIYVSYDGIKFLHSSCFFYKCSNTASGGAVYFSCLSSIIQHRFCTISCKGADGFHSQTYTNFWDRLYNYVLECSISSCIKEDESYVLDIQCGTCGILSSNLSKNFAKWGSAFKIHDSRNDCIVNFSTFESNKAKIAGCMKHNQKASGMFRDYFCNVINNSQEASNDGIISTVSNLDVENCSIIVTPGQSYTFYVWSGKLTIKDCFVNFYSVRNEDRTPVLTTKVIEGSELNFLTHLSTEKCKARNKETEDQFLYVDISFYILTDLLILGWA